MIVQYCSDLHLEFPLNKKYLKANPLKPEGEILLLGGDIVPFSEMDKENVFFDFVADHFERTFWIPGNHEYYHSDINQRRGVVNESIRSNVFLVNNCTIQYKAVRLIFSTLWSRIGPLKEWIIRQSMADFHLIKNHGKKISIMDYNILHEECKAFLTRELQPNVEQKTIVVSHHIPTFLNYPEKYRASDLNEAFAVELFDLIETSNVDYWMFGHSHEVVPDFKIGNTTLTTNQLGYVEYNEHLNFKNNRTVSIGLQ